MKTRLVVFLAFMGLLSPLGLSMSAYAAPTQAQCDANPALSGCGVQNSINSNLKCGSNVDLSGSGCQKTTNTTDLSSRVKTVINIGSAVVGAIAVVMIIVGGARYVSSGGKQDSVTSAKNTIIYAIVGLIIVALAQAIVHFVLNNTTG